METFTYNTFSFNFIFFTWEMFVFQILYILHFILLKMF